MSQTRGVANRGSTLTDGRRCRRLAKTIRPAVIGLVAYSLFVIGVMWFETLLVYPTWQIPPGDWTTGDILLEEVRFSAQDGTQLHGWYFPHASPRAEVLYCHGNGEHLGHMVEYLDYLRDEHQVSVFAFDYRGYGKSSGRPCEAGIVQDGQAAQQWLATRAKIALDDIVLWGRSLGGGLAVQLAANNGARAMILERTFTSLPDVAAQHYRWLPVRTLMRNRFDSLAQITQYDGPLLQSHGTADEVVSIDLGKRLFEASPSTQKRFVAMPGVTHNAPNNKSYYTELQDFLANVGGRPAEQ